MSEKKIVYAAPKDSDLKESAVDGMTELVEEDESFEYPQIGNKTIDDLIAELD